MYGFKQIILCERRKAVPLLQTEADKRKESKMKKPIAPCYNGGKDCSKRKVGCRKDCAGWQEYEKAMEEYKAALNKMKKAKYAVDELVIDRCRKDKYRK